MEKLSEKDVNIPTDVPKSAHKEYLQNYLAATQHTGNLMLFACDQKIEHLNGDFYGDATNVAMNIGLCVDCTVWGVVLGCE